MKLLPLAFALGVVAAAATSCKERSANSARTESPTVVDDSIAAAELAAFRASVTGQPRELDGPSSKEALVHAFEQDLMHSDTAALNRLRITPAEFAYLYYPDATLARPPYGLSPQIMWTQISSQSDRGLQRLLARFKGKKLQIRSLDCRPPDRQNGIVIHECGVVTGTSTAPQRLFGSIVERNGRFKFVGYANSL